MKSRIILAALLIAMLATLLVAVSASAKGNPNQFSSKVTPQLKHFQKAPKSVTQFAPSGTVSHNLNLQSGDKSQLTAKAADLISKVNRQLPSHKAVKSQAPTTNALGTPWPLVNPTVISPNPVALLATGKGLNAWDNYIVNPFDLEPPDQALCVGNGYVLEAVNLVAAVYDKNFKKVSGDTSLNDFFGLPDANIWFTSDPKCYFDPGNSHWYMTILSIDPFGDTFVNIAVSQTNNPTGKWYLYNLFTSFDCPDPVCLPDQPLLGADNYTIQISTNEFGATSFWGTNLYFIDKQALANGSNPALINVAFIPVGALLLTPPEPSDLDEHPCCWYSIQPAESPTAAMFDTRRGGTAYMMSTIAELAPNNLPGFFGAFEDTRVVVWAWNNTSSVTGNPGQWFLIANWTAVSGQRYGAPVLWARQKCDGVDPVAVWYTGVNQCGPINPNDSRMNQVVYVNGTLWGGTDSSAWVNLPTGPVLVDAVPWWGIAANWNVIGILSPSIISQGYVAPVANLGGALFDEDAVFPSIAFTPGNQGGLVFTLTGPEYYPSVAYTLMKNPGGVSSPVYIADKGQGSYDSFLWWRTGGGDTRWGDYSAAVGTGGQVFLAAEYIQYADCSFGTWLVDPTCHNTRGAFTNWGTGFAKVGP